MPGGDTALDDAMEVKELGSNPLTVLHLPRLCIVLVNTDAKKCT